MSFDLARIMLTTLKQYSNCEISLTFNDNNQQPVLSVCYKEKFFEVTNIQTLVVDRYENIESTIVAIDNVIKDNFQKTSI
ncbi:hypothetical protein JOC77_004335 [Peribacillus deserti]|uniref:Uncharacterized protein n=1 Tax=Peribacillus deserti TaxID=673318 RepID=A0ABS2QRI5_9BACI|nr:hypothetical protein [Peribacillus deserti]MBM7694856.1 hypothetical protein [Peribacillus deserti]